jgi:cytidine deaminase
VTSGHHSFPLVATYSNASQKVPFNGTVLDRLAEHFVRTDRRMKILHVQDGGTEVYQHRQLLPSSKAGESRPSLKPRALCAYKKYDVELIRPGGVFIPPSFIASLAQDLKHVLPNSTADGETRPGRKRHAAGVFTLSGDVYFGVNLRSDVRSIDRCAEWNALSAALVGGHNEIAGVMVFSPDYNEGKVCCCGKCLDSLGDFMSSELGNMFIVYVSSEGRVSDPVLYSSLRPVSYKQAEAGSPKPSLS